VKPADSAKFLQRRSFQAGQQIFAQGQVGTRAYVVESGEVEIVRVQGSRRRPLGTIGPGGIFGEMALVDDQPRMADAIALSACTCLVITRDQFRKKMESADPFLQGLLRIFVRNIRSMADVP
jgi:CRP-like cAMP-binding protein